MQAGEKADRHVGFSGQATFVETLAFMRFSAETVVDSCVHSEVPLGLSPCVHVSGT